MRLLLTVCLAIAAAASLATVSSADNMSSAANSASIVMPNSLTWGPVSNIPGASMAVLTGDPTKAGSLYTVRLKLPAGTKVPLHWHPDSERVTVLSGMLMFGSGATVDMASMKTLGPGSFIAIPAGVRHGAMAKTDTILQVTGSGPMVFNLVKQ